MSTKIDDTYFKAPLCDVEMSFRNSSEQKRWLVISKYTEFAKKDPSVTPTKIFNHFRFNGDKSIGYKFVCRTIERFKNSGRVTDKPRDVKKRKIDGPVRDSVVKHATNPKKPKYQRSTRKTAEVTHGKRGKKQKLSHTSVMNILKTANKKYKRTKRVPLVTEHHKRMKKLWAKKHMSDTVDDWMATMTIDETHYETFHHQNRQNSGSWVDEDEKAEVEQSVKHPGRVSASTGVCGLGAAPADLYSDRFNQKKFLDVHLKKQYVPAMSKFNCTRLMMDNDRSHHAKTCIKWLEKKGINYSAQPPPPCGKQRCRCKPPEGFWFPAYAPEVSPAELYNNYIQQELDKLSQRLGHPARLEILKRRVHQIIRKTPQSYFENLMAGMPRRVMEMYKANGGR